MKDAIQLVVLTAAELRAIVRGAVDEAIGSRSRPEWIPLRDSPAPIRSVRRAIRDGQVAAHKVGRALYVRRQDVENWIAEQPGPQPAGQSERERLLALATAPLRRRAAANRGRI